MTSLQFDRYFARSQTGRDLFIERTANHQLHDFTLSRSERLETDAQTFEIRPVQPRSAIAFESLLNCVQKILLAERLGQKLDGARLHGPYGHRYIPVAGDEDDRNMHVRLRELMLQVEAAQSGQTDVEHKARRCVLTLAKKELFRCCELFDAISDRPGESFQTFPNARIVVHDVYDWLVVIHLNQPF